jgi:hypothetical protein
MSVNQGSEFLCLYIEAHFHRYDINNLVCNVKELPIQPELQESLFWSRISCWKEFSVLGFFCSSVTQSLLVPWPQICLAPVPDKWIWSIGRTIWLARDNLKCSKKTHRNTSFSTRHPKWSVLGYNSGLRVEKPAAVRLLVTSTYAFQSEGFTGSVFAHWTAQLALLERSLITNCQLVCRLL